MKKISITICAIVFFLAASQTSMAGTTEIDVFDYSWGEVQLLVPGGGIETIILSGPSTVNTFFEGPIEGVADDNDLDGFDEVATEIVDINISGTSASLGSLQLVLNTAIQSLGEIEERNNNTAGTLDLPPFTIVGDANSFFDVYLEFDFSTVRLYNFSPIHISTVINEKPPAHGDIYEGSGPIQLFDENANPTEFYVNIFRYEPNPTLWDWGDAPDSSGSPRYPSLAVNNGASHAIVDGFMLGSAIDNEPNGQPDSTATGDDNDGNDDEDGVVFVTWPLIPGRPAVVDVNASANGLLYAWIDFDGDDSWGQVGDKIFDGQPVTAGVNSLVFQVPITAKENISTFSRFRFTSDPNLSYDGAASDGEVEDHIVKIQPRCGVKWIQRPDETPNGVDICVSNAGETIRTLADDFACTSIGLITDVHLWCSWKDDVIGDITNINLSIYSDDPIGSGGSDPENVYSKPDLLLWERDFGDGEFVEHLHTTVQPGEYWWDIVTGEVVPNGDTQIWEVDFYIDRADAFLQEGTSESPAVYWLAVQVDAENGEFGWKSRRWPNHYNDDAVLNIGTGHLSWQELRYPIKQHPYEGDSIDMAFIITTDDYCPRRTDLNCDGFVDFYDFAIFAAQWLQTSP